MDDLALPKSHCTHRADNRQLKRLVYELLDHDPTHQDTTYFFQRFQRELEAHGLKVLGVTTDASSLYPAGVSYI